MISPSPTHDHDKEHTLSRRSFLRLGGTALLLQLCEMGILLNISRYMRAEARESG